MQKRKEGLIPCTPETITLSPNKIKAHHPKCPRMGALLQQQHASITNLQQQKNKHDLQSSLSINRTGVTLNHPEPGTIVPSADNQVSSPEVSEIVSLENIKNNALNNSTTYLNEDRQKVLLLKINNEDQSNGQVRGMGWLWGMGGWGVVWEGRSSFKVSSSLSLAPFHRITTVCQAC